MACANDDLIEFEHNIRHDWLYLDNYNSDYKQDYYNLFMGYYNLGRLDLIQIIKVDGEINRFKPKKWVDDRYREFLQDKYNPINQQYYLWNCFQIENTKCYSEKLATCAGLATPKDSLLYHFQFIEIEILMKKYPLTVSLIEHANIGIHYSNFSLAKDREHGWPSGVRTRYRKGIGGYKDIESDFTQMTI